MNGFKNHSVETVSEVSQKSNVKVVTYTKRNIAGRLPENSRNTFVDRQSKKEVKKDRPKKFVFSLRADLLYFD